MTQGQSCSYWNTSWLNTNTLSYVKEFNKNHRINATAVFEQSYDNNYNHTSTAYNLDYIDRIGITTWYGLTLILPLSVQIASSIH